MVRVHIEQGYKLTLPKEIRGNFRIGDEVIASTDRAGRIVIMSAEQIRVRLQETFGMWLDRTDVPADGVDYMDEIRRGTRLDEVD